MPREFTETQQMLCLAALAYRGFADVGLPSVHDRRLHDDVASKLREITLLQGQWALVWGPSAYRAPVSLFDDAAMYVAKHTVHPDQYVVAVRGTNPISAFDWLFGDLWVAGQVPWPFDATKAARISISTALGLGILLQLRSKSQPTGVAGAAWEYLADRLGDFARGSRELLARRLEPDAVAPIRERLGKALRDLASRRVGLPAQDWAARVKSFQDEWSAPVRQHWIEEVAAGLRALGDQPSLHVLALLEKDASVSSRLAGGHELLSFLKAAVASARGAVDLVVTGHSKGGALSPALALWLAETQGAAAPAAYRWDPETRACVRCYAFAGPTAGNAAFAGLSNRVIGDRCHRTSNRLDIVPRAWVPADLRGIANLYEPVVTPIPGLGSLVNDVAAVVEHQQLGYAQIGNDVHELPGTIDAGKPDFVDQLVHQHLQAYLDQMGIGDVVNVDTFFNPLR